MKLLSGICGICTEEVSWGHSDKYSLSNKQPHTLLWHKGGLMALKLMQEHQNV